MPPASDSLVNEPPVVNIAEGMFGPLPPKVQARLNPLHKLMRTRLGAIIYVIIAMLVGFLPVIGITPIAYFLHWVGLTSHWSARRIIDNCIANWLSFMTVSF